jgi:hypothetical protein
LLQEKFILKVRPDTGLFADFVGRNSVKLLVAFDRNYFGVICIDGVISALP